jgi:hypothetical protein
MKKVVFAVFTFVYIATALATLVAFLVQARIIPTDLPAGAEIPFLGVLISAVLVETVVGYIAIAKDLFGIRASSSDSSTLCARFCATLAGGWWEKIKPDTTTALSFIEMTPDSASNTLLMKGSVYDRDGNTVAYWESEAVCIKLNENKLFYYWKGWHPERPNEPYEGFGEISFHAANNGVISGGIGFFSDTNLTNMQSTTKKSTILLRGTPQEAALMRTGHGKEVGELIRGKLASLV